MAANHEEDSVVKLLSRARICIYIALKHYSVALKCVGCFFPVDPEKCSFLKQGVGIPAPLSLLFLRRKLKAHADVRKERTGITSAPLSCGLRAFYGC